MIGGRNHPGPLWHNDPVLLVQNYQEHLRDLATWMRGPRAGASLALVALSLLPTLAASCSAQGLLTDGTSASGGTINNGYLRNGRRPPPQGIGFSSRSSGGSRAPTSGTDEANAIIRSAQKVAKEYPGATWGCRSCPSGSGESTPHRSHENGHDADLIWYARQNNKPVPPVDSMPAYGRDLSGQSAASNAQRGSPTPARFDIRRQLLALVRALLSDPDIPKCGTCSIHTRVARPPAARTAPASTT